MSNLKKCLVGIRESKLSIAQSELFINEVKKKEKIINNFSFEIKKIKTSGDIHNTQRLDILGGKGLFISEIEEKILSSELDLGIHSLKDVPAVDENPNLEIICLMKRYDPSDAFISNSESNIESLAPGSVIGTSSIRRRAQILSFRKDLKIKLLRGNIDTRIQKLKNNEYDAIILSLAGLQRIRQDHLVTEVLSHDIFLPAACQGAIGIQSKKNKNFKQVLLPINDFETEIECLIERNILKNINANCNSPISIYAKLNGEHVDIKCHIFTHDGKKIFNKTTKGHHESYKEITNEFSNHIIEEVGQDAIDKLNILKDDFNYTP